MRYNPLMTLSITDPAFLFPGISLLFLAYTNRYLALASIIRSLNSRAKTDETGNISQQISSLHLRITLIKYMQAFGVLGFLFCMLSMICIMLQQQNAAEALFVASLACMITSLILSLIEILNSGRSLKIELDRTQIKSRSANDDDD